MARRMKRKIEHLTPEQWADVRAYRDECALYGYAALPADRETAEACFAHMYERLGKPRPAVVWCAGPATAYLMSSLMRGASLGASLSASLRASLLASLRDSGASLSGSLRASLRDSLLASLSASLSASLLGSISDSLSDSLLASGASLPGSLLGSISDSLSDSLSASLRDSLRDSLGSLLGSLLDSLSASLRESGDRLRSEITWTWGQHDIPWVAHYRWPERAGLVHYEPEGSALLADLEGLARSCGWWWPREGQVWACERPTVQRVDERGRLHCETGPAMAFADGFSLYAWHGTTIPAQWIEERDTLDPALALTHPRIEQRRCVAEILGWERVLAQLDAQTLARDAYGELLEVALPDAGPCRFVRVRCATDRTFALPVPSDTQTALAGVAWTYQMTPDEYAQLEVRT